MIVCDTNVLVSGLVFPGGVPDKIIRAIFSGRFVHATSPDILTELRRILEGKIKLPKNSTDRLLHLISQSSHMVYPAERLSIVKTDEADNRILECAVTAQAKYLITGDHRHLIPLKSIQGILILSPREFIESIGIL